MFLRFIISLSVFPNRKKLPIKKLQLSKIGRLTFKKPNKNKFPALDIALNVLKSGGGVKINRSTLGIEVEVGYLISKKFFDNKRAITIKNMSKFITHMMPCIEIVGYRQKKQGIKFLGDLASDFGANIKFLIGSKKKFRRLNIGNLKCSIKNVKTF